VTWRAWVSAGLCLAIFGCRPPLKAPPEDHSIPQVKTLKVHAGAVVQRACSPSGPELCFNAVDDNCNGVLDEGCGVHTGVIQFAIAWSDPDADVDLNVIDPNGELVEVGRLTQSGLTKQRDCPGRSNACHGQNMENVYLDSGEPLPGKYSAFVRLERLGKADPPVSVMLGARVGQKTYSVEVKLERPEDERQVTLEF
jgi:tRNA (guanosine-2'-O-)-methyltransferase